MKENSATNEKLYILTYRTLPIGYAAIQCSHALREWIEHHPEDDKNWYKNSNFIILVTASNIKEFRKILAKADKLGIKYSTFLESDMAYQETAACFSPGEETRKLLKSCQLLGGPTPAAEEPKTTLDYKLLMKREMQGSSTISLWQHGADCKKAFIEIMNGEKFGILDKIPWLDNAIEEMKSSLGEMSKSNIKWQNILTYLQFHDIGKLRCKTTDENGIHYYNHPKESFKTWIEIGGDEFIANLMLKGMAMHSSNQKEIAATLYREEFKILRLTALAELISNSRNGIFGPEGIHETSFKIKFKKLKNNGSDSAFAYYAFYE